MGEKLVYKVSPIGADNANYLNITDIPAGILEQEDTVLMYPGDYSDPSSNATRFQNVSIVGVGRRDDIIFNGFTIPDAFTGAITFKGVSFASPGVTIGNTTATVKFYDCLFAGANSLNRASSLALGNACITKGVAVSAGKSANSTLVIEDSDFVAGTAYAIVAHDYGTITMRDCYMRTDSGVLSNAVCTFEQVIATGANNIVSTIASPAVVPAHVYRATVAVTSNAGNCTKTAVAVLS
jgi:hypothetical protein